MVKSGTPVVTVQEDGGAAFLPAFFATTYQEYAVFPARDEPTAQLVPVTVATRTGDSFLFYRQLI